MPPPHASRLLFGLVLLATGVKLLRDAVTGHGHETPAVSRMRSPGVVGVLGYIHQG